MTVINIFDNRIATASFRILKLVRLNERPIDFNLQVPNFGGKLLRQLRDFFLGLLNRQQWQKIECLNEFLLARVTTRVPIFNIDEYQKLTRRLSQ